MRRFSPWFLALTVCIAACDEGGNQSPPPDASALDARTADGDARVRDDASALPDRHLPSGDAETPSMPDAEVEECTCDWADGCELDCDCDPDCPTAPAGWTCSTYRLVDGYCDCGCGIRDEECTSFTIADCLVPNGCGDGMRPDPADPARCIANPDGWTCNGLSYDDGVYCNCGCGIVDPDCPTPLRWTACDLDGCPSGHGPALDDPTQCVDHPPQDDWSCDIGLLADGATCDCGCTAPDPDCPADATAASCEVTHCAAGEELDPSDVGVCQEHCAPSTETIGSATCTNGGSISIGPSCALDLSRCTDGHRYEVECSGGECLCRVDRACVSRSSAGFCGDVASTLNGVCGWSLVDDR